MSSSSISTRNLCKRFNREWIFRDFNYDFSEGARYVLTGPNGSGKSTLLQILWGQVPQTSGTINYQIENQPVAIEEIARLVSIATPYMDLIEEFTLQEQLDFHFKLKKIRSGFSTDDLLEIMYLSPAKNKFIGNFSSGMKQRLKLALAFYTDCRLLFLDEPGTNLDEQAFEWYRVELAKIPLNNIVILASNDPFEYTPNFKVISLPDYK